MKIQLNGILKSKKTYVAGALGLGTVIGAYLVGDISVVEAIPVAIPLLGVIFLKRELDDATAAKVDAIATKAKKKEEE